MPLAMTALSVGFSPHKVNDPKRRDGVANGQFILIKRTVYEAIGGHERIEGQIVEDKAMKNIYLGLRDWSGLLALGAFGGVLSVNDPALLETGIYDKMASKPTPAP